jgi:hypothetical protein
MVKSVTMTNLTLHPIHVDAVICPLYALPKPQFSLISRTIPTCLSPTSMVVTEIGVDFIGKEDLEPGVNHFTRFSKEELKKRRKIF